MIMMVSSTILQHEDFNRGHEPHFYGSILIEMDNIELKTNTVATLTNSTRP